VRPLADVRQRLAPVDRTERARVQRVHGVLVVRIGEHVRVVEGALPDVASGIHQLPRRARIVGAEQAAVLVLDERVDAARIGASDRDAYLAEDPWGGAWVACDPAPRPAAVDRFEEAAARTAARHLILDAIRLPERRKDNVRIPPIDLDVDPAGLRVAEQCALPRPAAVGALVDAALVARRAVAPEIGHEDDVGVGRVNADLGNGVARREADVAPGLAGVRRFVDAVAGHDVAADARLAHADEDDVGARFGDGDGADRGAANLAVGHRRPLRAAVGRLPE